MRKALHLTLPSRKIMKQTGWSTCPCRKRSAEGSFLDPREFKNRDWRDVKCHHPISPCTLQSLGAWEHWVQVCPSSFRAWGVRAWSGGTSESLGSNLPHDDPKSLGLFQSGMVSPVTAHTDTYTETNTLQQASDSFKGWDYIKTPRREIVSRFKKHVQCTSGLLTQIIGSKAPQKSVLVRISRRQSECERFAGSCQAFKKNPWEPLLEFAPVLGEGIRDGRSKQRVLQSPQSATSS